MYISIVAPPCSQYLWAVSQRKPRWDLYLGITKRGSVWGFGHLRVSENGLESISCLHEVCAVHVDLDLSICNGKKLLTAANRSWPQTVTFIERKRESSGFD